MRLLIISPDYVSHTLPLVQIGSAWAGTEGDVVVATGSATRGAVEAAGLAWVELRLGAGHNGGVITAEEQPSGEDEHLRAFFDATRKGPVATLTYQADARRHDLLHEPDRVLDRLATIVDEVRPDRVVVDHVAFGARLALAALGIEAATVVLGHPSALPAKGEVYGSPPEWPAALRPTALELAELERLCQVSVDHLRAASREFLDRRAPEHPVIDDLTSTPGRPTIYVYPEDLHDPDRPLTGDHVFVGALRRAESLADFPLPSGRGPRVTVALGSFLSARDDVISTAIAAARAGNWCLTLAHGSSDVGRLGPMPPGAVIARHIPQVAVLAHSDIVVHHGGNGSVVEAAAAGVPMVVLPFSTDQFAAAAAIERTALGAVLAPNTLTADELVAAVDAVLTSDAVGRIGEVAHAIERAGGPTSAVKAIVEHGRSPRPVAREPGARGRTAFEPSVSDRPTNLSDASAERFPG